VRPSTVASAIQTQAEFDVRVASSGQVVTAIGITRICRGIYGVLDRLIVPFHRNEQRQRRTDTGSVQPRLDLLA
jgi:hypothetical protein